MLNFFILTLASTTLSSSTNFCQDFLYFFGMKIKYIFYPFYLSNVFPLFISVSFLGLETIYSNLKQQTIKV